MILHSQVSDQAVLSNVQGMGEFRIRNSAKAFSILSSGLYANKIRAIIRELSCNAIDSHTANGNVNTPFDVHLPTSLEPWFAIRDYGTGLSHEQVHSIYTTYFESTKTGSNDFVGALGLGSKSPFSYTDNFTVTAVKDGCKSVYSAFINQEGVPSIVLMATNKRFVVSTETDEDGEVTEIYSLPADEADCTEPNGVEVKFSVNERWDFSTFVEEAKHVYKYFTNRPVISGVSEFVFAEPKYDVKDIVPGVHSYKQGSSRSVAVMGNIAYPIDIPRANTSINQSMHRMLDCGLEMHFEIGELDFQASREGLSYIPETVEAIKKRLEQVSAALAVIVEQDAKKIKNLWARAFFLAERGRSYLWADSVASYVTANPIATVKVDHRSVSTGSFDIDVDILAKKYNIVVSGMHKYRGRNAFHTIGSRTQYNHKLPGSPVERVYYEFSVSKSIWFVINDIKKGAIERTRYNWKNNAKLIKAAEEQYQSDIFVLSPADSTKEMDVKKFLKDIKNPPNVLKASEMDAKPKASRAGSANVTILSLQRRGGSSYRRDADDMVWRAEDKKLGAFDTKEVHYYLPLSGFSALTKTGEHLNVKSLMHYFNTTGVDNKFTVNKVYGVRKADIKEVEAMKNWVNFEDFIVKTLNSLTLHDLSKIIAKEMQGKLSSAIKRDHLAYITDHSGLYYSVVSKLPSTRVSSHGVNTLENLCAMFNTQITNSPVTIVREQLKQCTELVKQYPLLSSVNEYANSEHVAQYINLVDASLSNKAVD